VLYIGGQPFNVDAPVVNWHDNGWDATSPYCIATQNDTGSKCRAAPGGQEPYSVPPQPPGKPYLRRYAYRPGIGERLSYNSVKQMVKQFVVHHDGCTSADMCFSVLQNERGLSVHFLLDNDGTIFQTIDLGYMAYHASDWNLYSIGVELCNRGDATQYGDTYKAGRFGPDRETRNCKINNNTIKAFDYTKAQYESFQQLCKELLRLLPNLPAEYPQSSPGEQMWDTLPNASIERERYAGYIGHYHITNQKWDPGPFDFKDFCKRLRGALCFPVFPKLEPAKGEDKPVVPEDTGELRQASNALYQLNEAKADGGFFPVGPWGESRLWHGGVHMIGKADGGVFAPYPGRLVAARMGKESSTGSQNFVLLRHDMTLGSRKILFYSLYMHLADELKRPAPVEWMTKDAWKASGKAGVVALLDEPIEAGSLIGHVGKAGPDELARSQVHVEFFSESFIDEPEWQLVDGTAGGRFCEAPEINAVIDANHDGILSRPELTEFFQRGSGELHRMVTLHVSEWTFEPRWAEVLVVPKDFRGKKAAEIQAMVDDQITPGLWWDGKVAAHCRLPADGVVHHYHPVAFMSWFKTKLIEAATAAAKDDKNKVHEADVKAVPKSITDDYHDFSGTSMRGTADVAEDPCNKNLTLEQMVQGFDAPECSSK
jgi:hypothetical protein